MFLRGFSGVFGEKNVLVNVSQNHRYYSGDLNSSSRIREQEEALFPALAGARLFSLSLSIPCCLRGPDKTHKYLGRGNLSMLRWDSNCLMKRLITWFCIYYLFSYFLALWCCYGTLAFEVLMVVPF